MHSILATKVSGRGNKKDELKDFQRLSETSHSGPRLPQSFSAEDFHKHIVEKINSIREATSTSCPPTSAIPRAGWAPPFLAFSHPSIPEVITAVKSHANKQRHSDPVPTWLLNELSRVHHSSLILITTLLLFSLATGEFPALWKHVIISLDLK